jgi:hypothetical protein
MPPKVLDVLDMLVLCLPSQPAATSKLQKELSEST